MRWGWFAVSLLFTLSSAASGRGAEFPYVGIISSDDVYVRSGPGKNYYPTDKLRKGEKVEIYRHDPGGWCAIRPPRNSFSWVSAKHLQSTGHGLAVVADERTVARVGSAFSDVRDVIQVRLEKGEKVELVGPGEAAGSPWAKIAPPAGEFRWVYNKFLDRDDGEQLVTAEEPRAGNEQDQPGARLAAAQSPEPIVVRASNSSDASRGKPAGETRLSEEQIQKELHEIDIELSSMVAEEITAWSFGELRRRAEKCLDDAPTALSRGRVRIVLNKMSRFEDLKTRHDTVLAAREDTDRKNRQIGDTPGLVRDEANAPRFDGVGRLSPVMARKGNYPQFALVDARGEVVLFVNPAPGVNLRPYLNKQVGVNGPRSYVSGLQKQQIDAQRVAELPGNTRR